jgi:hypothetical protein
MAGAQQILNLRIGLAATELRRYLDESEIGRWQIECLGYSRDDDLGDQRAWTLPCAAELDDIEAIVGVDDCGK